MSTAPVDVAAVVVTYNSRQHVGALLDSLPAALGGLSYSVVVVDNGSTDGTLTRIAELVPEATVIEAGQNLGFAGGCNRAAAEATGNLILLLNPDNVVSAGFRNAIELPLLEGRGWGAWQGLVTDDGGRALVLITLFSEALGTRVERDALGRVIWI